MENHVVVKKDSTELYVLTWKKLSGVGGNSYKHGDSIIDPILLKISLYTYVYLRKCLEKIVT